MVASWACEVTEILTQRGSEEDSLYEDYSDPTHPTFNKIPDIYTWLFLLYVTLFKKYFSCICVHIV